MYNVTNTQVTYPNSTIEFKRGTTNFRTRRHQYQSKVHSQQTMTFFTSKHINRIRNSISTATWHTPLAYFALRKGVRLSDFCRALNACQFVVYFIFSLASVQIFTCAIRTYTCMFHEAPESKFNLLAIPGGPKRSDTHFGIAFS